MLKNVDKSLSGIHFQEVNTNSSKPCLVFLHGLGGDLTTFNPLRNYFHNLGFPTLAIDLRGQGKSIRPQNTAEYTLIKLAQDVHEILISEKFMQYVVIGHSGGGIIAQILCSQHPNKIIGLALVNSTSRIDSRLARFVRNSFIFTFITTCISFLPSWHKEDYADYRKFIETTDYNWKRIGSDILHTGLRSYLSLFLEFLVFNGTELVKNIRVPTLVVGGGKDTVFPRKITLDLASQIKNSTAVFIEDTNHISIINNPRLVCEVIEKFLNSESKLQICLHNN